MFKVLEEIAMKKNGLTLLDEAVGVNEINLGKKCSLDENLGFVPFVQNYSKKNNPKGDTEKCFTLINCEALEFNH